MSTETDIEQNQYFSVGTSPEQKKIMEAKELLTECREYVYRATVERNALAYPTLAKLDAFVKNA